MAGFIRGRRRLSMLLVATLAAVTALLVVEQAQAATQVVEQHSELLAETGAFTSSRTLSIYRGSLPGATSKFDPQPTATPEVAGQHTGGMGASRYDVTLRKPGAVLATVSFTASDTTFVVKTAPITWPAQDTELREIQITRINDGLNLAGTLTLQKAYLKIHQEGVIKKTVARLPLAVKQISITNTGWADVADLVFYKHVAADFDPAPTVSFRSTGIEKTQNPIFQSLHVRLVDQLGNALADNIHSALGSVSSAPLNLVDGRTYRVQVRVDVNTPPENGELYSADLVFEQATTDPAGLSKTVGFYPSVTAASAIVADATNLGFLFNSPANAIPDPIVAEWDLSIKRTADTGSATAMLYDAAAGAALATQSTSSASWDLAVQPSVTLPTSPRALDTRTSASVGSTGRLSSSVLREALSLRPVISTVAPSPVEIGREVTITGAGFTSGAVPGTVFIGGRSAYVNSWAPTEIKAWVPPSTPAGPAEVQVWAAGVSSNIAQVQVPNYSTPPAGIDYPRGRINFRVRTGASPAIIALRNGDSAAALTQIFPNNPDPLLSRWHALSVGSGTELDKTRTYAVDPDVEWAEVPSAYEPATHPVRYPNDPLFRYQWGLRNAPWPPSGADPHEPSVDVDAELAWGITAGSASTVIAIIDSGVMSHEDLDGNRLSEVQTDGCPNAAPYHGAKVAGVAAAVTNNYTGIAGMGWSTKFRSYKVEQVREVGTPPRCVFNGEDVARAIVEASYNMRDAVINLSFTDKGLCNSVVIQQAIKQAWDRGTVIVAAAGNDGSTRPTCPASYDYVLAVGSHGSDGKLSNAAWDNYDYYATNYGPWVDVYAPGGALTTDPSGTAHNGPYRFVSGTSISAAFVSGTAALLSAQGYDNCQIYKSIASQTHRRPDSSAQNYQLDAFSALSVHPPCVTHPPGAFVRDARTRRTSDYSGTFSGFTAPKDFIGKGYFVDLDGVRPVTSSAVLGSWGPDQAVALYDVEFKSRHQTNLASPLGFRPGTVIANSDAGGTLHYVVTSDGSWTRGIKRQLLPSAFLACGYDLFAVTPATQLEADLHPTGEPIAACDTLPRGAAVRTEGTDKPLYWMIDRDSGGSLVKRFFQDNAPRDSWGITDGQALRPNALNTDWFDALTQGANVGLRPGTVGRAVGPDVTKFLITAEGDFAAGVRRPFYYDTAQGDRAFLNCWLYDPTRVVDVAAEVRDVHPLGATLGC